MMPGANNTLLAINIAGAAVIIMIAGYFVHDALRDEQVAPCAGRYPSATAYDLRKRDGDLVSPIELQARAGDGEWGILDKLATVEVEGAPAAQAFEFRLPKGDGTTRQERSGGVSFAWSPVALTETGAVCVAYSVWLAHDFEPGPGGTLPGVYANAVHDTESDKTRPFQSQLFWNRDGFVGLAAFDPSQRDDAQGTGITSTYRLPTGRWVRLEQEIVLNEEGRSNGMVRLWADGDLKLDRGNLTLRRTAATRIAGVLANVSYGGPRGVGGVARKDTTIRLSPFEISWRN